MKRATDRRGFTLIEILVATAILVVLAVAMAMMMRSSMNLWSRGEDRRTLYHKAQHLFDHYFSRDFSSVYCSLVDSTLNNQSWFIADRGPTEKIVRLRFLRTDLQRSQAHQLYGFVGLDGRPPLEGIDLIPNTGGFTEVIYVIRADPDNGTYGLYRNEILAVKSNYALRQKNGEKKAFPANPASLNLNLICEGILYFDILFWAQDTKTWTPHSDNKQGPEAVWDSTRGYLPKTGGGLNSFRFFKSKSSFKDYYYDDIFPERVKITLVLKSDSEVSKNKKPKLSAALSDGSLALSLSRPIRISQEGFVKIDDEWIQYDGVKGAMLHIAARGVRRTKPAAHLAGAICVFGETFSQVFELPLYRDDTNP